jgi:hypothetical protein
VLNCARKRQNIHTQQGSGSVGDLQYYFPTEWLPDIHQFLFQQVSDSMDLRQIECKVAVGHESTFELVRVENQQDEELPIVVFLVV